MRSCNKQRSGCLTRNTRSRAKLSHGQIPTSTACPRTCRARNPINTNFVFSLFLLFSLFSTDSRLLANRIVHHLETSDHLALQQHAYRRGGSTTTALYSAMKFTQDALHDNEVCVMTFLDISGAFDRTWHGGILHRLLQYGVPVYLVAVIKSFLNNRIACMCQGGEQHEVDLSQGCPQAC